MNYVHNLRGVALWATLVSAVIAGDAAAQDASLRHMLGTISVEAKPSFAGGELNGCIVEYNVLAQDRVYKQGGYIFVTGSFGVMSTQGKLAAILKVVLHDFDPRTMKSTPSPPASAYFVSGNSTTKNAVVSSYPSDVPGAIFVVLQMTPTFSIIADGLSKDRLVIAFARTKGGSDIGLAVETNVADTDNLGQRTRSPNTALNFYDCAKSLVQQ